MDNHPKIVINYLRTWFAVDFLTLFLPGGFDLYESSFAASSDSTSSVFSSEAEGFLEVLKACRLFKLVRLVRLSRIITRWRAKVTISYAHEALIRCAVMLCASRRPMK